MKIAVISGASSGMGREFVYALDKQTKYDEIWVIARRRDRLEALAEKTRAKIRPVPMDLTDVKSIENFAELLKSEKPEIQTLVNASGYGKFESFENIDLKDDYGMIDLNCKAYVGMTKVCTGDH